MSTTVEVITVGELIVLLQAQPQDAPILIDYDMNWVYKGKDCIKLHGSDEISSNFWLFSPDTPSEKRYFVEIK